MKMISGLKLGFYDVVTSLPDDFAAFNIKSNHPQDLITQVINTKSVTIEFSTSTGALAYAVTKEEYISVFATDASTMQFSNVELGEVQRGFYDEFGEFQVLETFNIDGNLLNLEAGELYRIVIISVGEDLVPTTWEEIGS